MRESSKTSSLRVIRDSLAWFLPEAFRYKPLFFPLVALFVLVETVWPFVNIFIAPLLIAELTGERNTQRLVQLVALLVGTNSALGLLRMVLNNILGKYEDLFNRHFSLLLTDKIMTMSFSLTEEASVLEQLEKARNGASWYSGGVYGLTLCVASILRRVLVGFGSITVIILQAPLLIPIASLAIALEALFNARANALEVKHWLALSNINRIFGYVFWELNDFRFGKDIRLYGAQKMMLDKADAMNEVMTGKWRDHAFATRRYYFLSNIVGTLRDALFYVYIGYLALSGAISIADFTRLSAAGGSLSGSLRELVFEVQNLSKKSGYAIEFVRFMEFKDPEIHGTASPAPQAEHRIEFRGVSFSYPGAKEAALNCVHAVIEPGEKISIVGLNGAGKTTFIKLLCRLYDPDEGSILLDGVDIRQYDRDEYRKLLSVVFQDFKLFAFSLKENIAPLAPDESEEAIETLARRVGLGSFLDKNAKGIGTTLFKQFEEDGVEPSGGEQQKIAIARALYKDAPILILDEPTAALDPHAEYEIYRHFHEMAGGKTALYISHRLSSCRFCDRILVFKEGRIIEEGTHDELIGQEGLYREMFSAQAAAYVEGA